MSNNAHELSNRLLNALDTNYNVVDMPAVSEIISILEKFNITKELLETTRLGKHVNELRRKTTDPTLARRAKVLVKRWRDLVIPTVASPAHTGSNRSSAERQMRRLGGTPLTSPALSRQVVSPAVPSPRPLSRPAWGGYESDSQDVILVDDDPPAPPAPLLSAHNTNTPPVKRAISPEPVQDDKKAKRDKKPKKRRGHSRAGSGTETPAAVGALAAVGGPPAAAGAPGWSSRNGSGPERRRNGVRDPRADPYAALVQRLPPAGAKKVKTTKELQEQLQSRGSAPLSRAVSPRSPHSPHSPHSPDVMVIEPDACPIVKVESPLRNGGEVKPEVEEVEPPAGSQSPLEEERERPECTCEGEESEDCPAANTWRVRPRHVYALHNALLPGINGTKAPLVPHPFPVRKTADPERPGLFANVVPLYKYTDYSDDCLVKNLARAPLCTHLPWTQFAPPQENDVEDKKDVKKIDLQDSTDINDIKMECDPISPKLEDMLETSEQPIEPNERLQESLLTKEEETQPDAEAKVKLETEKDFTSEPQEHRTVERTKEELDGRTLYALCSTARESVPWNYGQAGSAPVIPASQLDGPGADERLTDALEIEPERDELGRPLPPVKFAEWHECARLGELIALPYVVID